MAKINQNFLKLPGGYLFPEIGRRVRAFSAEDPPMPLIRLGIGDVTLPLAPTAVEAMTKATAEMGVKETFRGYCEETCGAYDFLRFAIRDDYKARGVDIADDEIFVSDGAKTDCGSIGDIFSVDNVVAVCDPVYPVYVDTNAMAGRAGDYDGEKWTELVYLPCTAENGFFPELPAGAAIVLAILATMVVGGIVGFINGFFVAKFKLHPFIVTLATQLMTYSVILLVFMLGGNNGQPMNGLRPEYTNFVKGTMVEIGGAALPWYVLYAVIFAVLMWFIWNKTTFGKNMFAVGSNQEAASVSGVNVFKTIVMVHTLAGIMYGLNGFIEAARLSSVNQATGLNYECDAIAACVIGGVSFVGGTGKISGIVLGVFILRIIFVALQFLSIDQNLQFLIKGAIILFACSLDMRKYLAKK